MNRPLQTLDAAQDAAGVAQVRGGHQAQGSLVGGEAQAEAQPVVAGNDHEGHAIGEEQPQPATRRDLALPCGGRGRR